MVDLSINFCGRRFSNPFILPSGIYSSTGAYEKALKAGASSVTLKSLTRKKREGNPMPRVWKYDCGVINSVGLTNPGIEKGALEIGDFVKKHPDVPVIASLFSTKIREFVYLVEKVIPQKPPLIELNLSCPNVEDELGKSLGMEKGAAGKIVKEVNKISGKTPILAKLSPNVSNISEIALACEANGADAIVVVNTVGPGMIIDIEKKKPILGAKRGGVSGPGILPIAVRCVYDVYEKVKIPIIGMGGVTKWQDAVEMILAGATLVGVGTATYGKGINVYHELQQGLSSYMEKEGVKRLKDLVGGAHE